MDLLEGKILGFMLVATRTGAFFAVCPVFSWQAVPLNIKIAVAVVSAVFFSGITGCPYNAENLEFAEVVLMLACEALYGLALGYVSILIFSAVKLSAGICEREMGLTMANILDPLSGEDSEPMSIMIEMIFVLLFLSANGHHILLSALSRSYQTVPTGTMPDAAVLLQSVASAGSAMLMVGLKIAVPVMAAFLALMVVLAVLARINPETDILFLSFPLRVGLGLMMVAAFLPFINEYTREFASWMDKLLPL